MYDAIHSSIQAETELNRNKEENMSTLIAEITPDRILKAMSGYMVAQCIFAANRFEIPKILGKGPLTSEEVARQVGIKERKARTILSVLESEGLFMKVDGKYANSPDTDFYLAGKVTEKDKRPLLKFYGTMSFPFWGDFIKAVQSDGPIFGNLEFENEEQQRIFTEGVEAKTFETAEALATRYNFSQHSDVFDAGGGRGSFGILIMEQHLDVSYALFEKPDVAKLARERFAGHKFADRVRIYEGDLFKDSLPVRGNCVVMIANVIHLFDPEGICELLRCIRKSVPDGARALIVDYLTGVEGAESVVTRRWGGEFMMFSGGLGGGYDRAEVLHYLHQTGWRYRGTIPLTSHTSCVIAEAIGG